MKNVVPAKVSETGMCFFHHTGAIILPCFKSPQAARDSSRYSVFLILDTISDTQ